MVLVDIFALVTAVLSFLAVYGAAQRCLSGFITATCQLRTNPSTENPSGPITGTVTFSQRVTATCRRLGTLCMHVQVQGLPQNVDNHYGLHVHESADLRNGCESFGPHYNPLGSNHGGPTDSLDMRHMGDFGNLRLNSRGDVDVTLTDYLANLSGNNGIIRRGLVLHAMRDDLGLGGIPASLTTGNSGARLACCEILQT
ncbi:hypothetical protein ACJMK2_028428 [Sinanodonta woodiana]|uniref:Superoxide dismutase copper/zinc binding domain-containing protein n=1 Tax=Sinanodonta woodiana TaxID=1069815 RepID=A0ABD3XAP3_SINWO